MPRLWYYFMLKPCLPLLVKRRKQLNALASQEEPFSRLGKHVRFTSKSYNVTCPIQEQVLKLGS